MLFRHFCLPQKVDMEESPGDNLPSTSHTNATTPLPASPMGSMAGSTPITARPAASGSGNQPVIERVNVLCNGTQGTLLITTQAIVCKCATCATVLSPQGGRVMTPTEFERHAGMAASKKWRRSIKVDLGGAGR